MNAASQPVPRGIVLFAHGARDARWAEPFERLRDLVAAKDRDARVGLAFLELMRPDLTEAAAALAAQGCRAVTIVPVFLGHGGHLRRDLPDRVEALRRSLPGLDVTVAGPVGEDDAVLAAMADYCAHACADEP